MPKGTFEFGFPHVRDPSIVPVFLFFINFGHYRELAFKLLVTIVVNKMHIKRERDRGKTTLRHINDYLIVKFL